MVFSLHTSISLDEGGEVNIEQVVIPEAQLDVYRIIPSTTEPSKPRDSKYRGGSLSLTNSHDGQSQKYTSYNYTPMLLSQILSSSGIPTSDKWSLKKKQCSSAGWDISQEVNNKRKQRTLNV